MADAPSPTKRESGGKKKKGAVIRGPLPGFRVLGDAEGKYDAKVYFLGNVKRGKIKEEEKRENPVTGLVTLRRALHLASRGGKKKRGKKDYFKPFSTSPRGMEKREKKKRKKKGGLLWCVDGASDH